MFPDYQKPSPIPKPTHGRLLKFHILPVVVSGVSIPVAIKNQIY